MPPLGHLFPTPHLLVTLLQLPGEPPVAPPLTLSSPLFPAQHPHDLAGLLTLGILCLPLVWFFPPMFPSQSNELVATSVTASSAWLRGRHIPDSQEYLLNIHK